MVFETDCKVIVDAFHSHRIDQSELRCLVKDCKALFSLGANLTLHFIKRQANRVAHIVARVVCYNDSLFYWLKAPPFIVESIVNIVFLVDP